MEKKIFISADIEGVSGITSWAATEYGGKGYEKACQQMSLETAAACRGAIRAGYLPVVKDGHEDAMNIDHDLLPQEAELISGWACTPLSMLAGLDESFAGITFCKSDQSRFFCVLLLPDPGNQLFPQGENLSFVWLSHF